MRIIHTEPLTAEAFLPFGQVLQAAAKGSSANQGTAVRVDRVAALLSSREGCPPNLAMIRALSSGLHIPAEVLVREPASVYRVKRPKRKQAFRAV